MKNLTFGGGRGVWGKVTRFINFNVNYYCKHVKMFRFKFKQNRTINGMGVGARGPQSKMLISIIGKHMQIVCFKFQQN